MRDRIRGLDELRGLAILFVMLDHISQVTGVPEPLPASLPWTGIGVYLFFVISGFLITTILVTTRHRAGYFRVFYARRALRILPLAWILVGVSYALFPATRDLVWPYLLFYNNYAVQTTGRLMAGLGVMWTLAIEEQFYLFWPLVCIALPRRLLWLAPAGIVVASYSLGVLTRPGGPYAQFAAGQWSTHLHIFVIAIGAWLALMRQKLIPYPWVCLAALVAWLACLKLAVGGLLTTTDFLIMGLIVTPVWFAVTFHTELVWKPLRWLGLRWLGLRCYGLYLMHSFVNLALQYFLPRGTDPLLFTGLSLGLSAAAAAISYRYFELPILRLAPHYPPAPRDDNVGVSASQAPSESVPVNSASAV
jgi:peptidoglycan/LPS O-acetylase OafA/YrhL